MNDPDGRSTSGAGAVLVVCDERGGALEGLLRWLSSSGIACERCTPAQCTPLHLQALRPALVVIDAVWPPPAPQGVSGPLATVAALRAASGVPLACVTAGQLPDVDLLALEAGCDQVWHADEPAWLLARRCAACLRRAAERGGVTPLTLSGRDGLLRLGQRRAQLSQAQARALERLLQAAPNAVSRATLAAVALGCVASAPGALRRVDVLMARLRLRLRDAHLSELRILAVRKVGYRAEHVAAG
jgi:DNA-binding response OmpR family regulator